MIILSQIEVRKDESFESALRRFKKKIEQEGILREVGTASITKNPVKRKGRGQREEDNGVFRAFNFVECTWPQRR